MVSGNSSPSQVKESSCHIQDKKDRIFICSFCGFFGHRDLVGAENILIKGMRSLTQSTHQGETALSGGSYAVVS